MSQALAQWESLTSSLPDPTSTIKSEHLRLRALIAAQPEAIAAADLHPSMVRRFVLWASLPWEQAQAIRLLNHLMAENLLTCQGVIPVAEAGGRLHYPESRLYRESGPYHQFDRPTRTTPLLDLLYPVPIRRTEDMIRTYAWREAQR